MEGRVNNRGRECKSVLKGVRGGGIQAKGGGGVVGRRAVGKGAFIRKI